MYFSDMHYWEKSNMLLTQSFVHKTHYAIFGFFYPWDFENWFSDDWLMQVYNAKSLLYPSHQRVTNTNVYGTRYSACSHESRSRIVLRYTLYQGGLSIDSFMKGVKY